MFTVKCVAFFLGASVLCMFVTGFQNNPTSFPVLENATTSLPPKESSYRNGRGYSGDVYLDSAYDTCVTSKNAWACVKYKALRYLHKVASPVLDRSRDVQLSQGLQLLGSSIHLVTIPESMAASKDSITKMFPDSQPRSSDSELEGLYKFALREAERFVRTHALSVKVPSGATSGRDLDSAQSPRLIDEDQPENDVHDNLTAEGRGKKKKLALLLPLLFFFKLKVLLVPILLGVLFIKKLLILATVLFPSLLSLVKFCKPHHNHSGWSSGPDTSGEYSTGYGHVAPYHGDYHGRRSGRWDDRASPYRGYQRANEERGV